MTPGHSAQPLRTYFFAKGTRAIAGMSGRDSVVIGSVRARSYQEAISKAAHKLAQRSSSSA